MWTQRSKSRFGKESMSCAKRYFPEFIVKSFPRFFVEKLMEFRAGKLKSMQLEISHKINCDKMLQLGSEFLTGQ